MTGRQDGLNFNRSHVSRDCAAQTENIFGLGSLIKLTRPCLDYPIHLIIWRKNQIWLQIYGGQRKCPGKVSFIIMFENNLRFVVFTQ